MRRAWNRGPAQFDGATIHLLPDLPRRTLYMSCQVKPLLDKVKDCGGTYGWSYTFGPTIRLHNDIIFFLNDHGQ